MATTQGLYIEVRNDVTTEKEAHRAVRKAMQALKISKIKSDRFEMSAQTVLDDAARILGCSAHMLWDSQGPIFVFGER